MTGLQKTYARIETTQYLTNADPVQFTDGVSRNVHNIRKIVIENTVTSSGLPEFINFINVGQWKDATDALSLAITALQATDVSLQTQITAITPKNIGSFGNITTPFNPPTTSGSFPVTGNITSAVAQSDGSILITLSNTMPSLNYYVRCIVESLGAGMGDANLGGSAFYKISTTQFYYKVGEPFSGTTQALRVHLEVIAF